MILCADIGGSFIDFALFDDNGQLRSRQAVPTPVHDVQAFADSLAALCEPWPEIALHIAIAGVEDPATGIVHAANIPAIAKTSLSQLLAKRTNRRVLIGNDADCFALAEARFGIAANHRNVFGIILGTGVGGGLVVDGNIVPAMGGVSGEWGHGPLVIPPPGATDAFDFSKIVPYFPCGCGQAGCLDTIAGARGLERLYQWVGGAPANSREIFTRWQEGEAFACRTLHIYVTYVSSALALAVNTTGSSIIPVGGGLGSFTPLVTALDDAVRSRILVKRTDPLVVQAVLGADAGLLGAACLHDSQAR